MGFKFQISFPAIQVIESLVRLEAILVPRRIPWEWLEMGHFNKVIALKPHKSIPNPTTPKNVTSGTFNPFALPVFLPPPAAPPWLGLGLTPVSPDVALGALDVGASALGLPSGPASETGPEGCGGNRMEYASSSERVVEGGSGMGNGSESRSTEGVAAGPGLEGGGDAVGAPTREEVSALCGG
jgi:hypothetical protein